MVISLKRIFPAVGSLLAAGFLAGCSGSSSGGGTPTTGMSADTIVFVSTRNGNQELFSMRSDGSEARRLTGTPASESNPSRSRDGKHVVFSSNRAGNDEIYTLEFGADGAPGTVTRLTADGGTTLPSDTNPIFSPDGSKILWTSTRGGARGFWVMDRTGDNQVRVAGTTPVGLFDPSWHPDSTRLIGFRGTGPGTFELGTFVPGGAFTALTNTASGGHARVSPDGTRVAWQAGATGAPLSIFSLLIGSPPAVVAAGAAGRDFAEPTWSPDGQSLVYTGEDAAGRPQIFIRKLGETTETRLTTTGDNFSPTWVD